MSTGTMGAPFPLTLHAEARARTRDLHRSRGDRELRELHPDFAAEGAGVPMTLLPR
jgi:hypothetical protein